MKRLHEFLKRHAVIGLDTPIFIYHLEDHPRYAPLTDVIFSALEKGAYRGITSYLTLMEILVKPIAAGFLDAARDYEYYLTTFPNLSLFEMNLEVARRASEVRARERIKFPDAIQIATAIINGATAFLTNDPAFEKVAGMDILVLERMRKK